LVKIYYTDGACKGNPGPGGFGVVCIDESQVRKRDQWGNWTANHYTTYIDYKYSEQCEQTTNNREELKAILHVFSLAAKDTENQYIIYSDSAYAVNIINSWIYNWVKNDWKNSKNKVIENIDLVKEIYNYLTINFFNCQVKKCSGHVGNIGNELADALATNNTLKFNKIIKENNICNDII
jgi:ribonuclease HI